MRFQKLQRTIIAYGMISTLVEIPHSQFVKHLENFLADHVSKISAPPGAPEYFSILSAIPEESRQRQEAKSLLRLLQTVKKSKKLFNAVASLKPGEGSKKFLRPPGDPAMLSFYRQLNYHVKEFCWAYYGYEGPAYGIDRPLSELAQLLSDKVDPAAELKRLARERAQIRPATKIAERTLKLSAYERALFQALRDTVFMKLYRKDAMTFGFYSAESLLKELARRAGIALAAAKCLAPGEYARALRQDKKLIAELYRRIPYAVYAADSLKPRVLSGSRARRFIKSIYREEAVGDVRELKGQVACLGHATGAVKIINVAAEMGKMNKGDILVSIATIPDIVPAMKKAAAIVTEQGGITSHAAIVSRELGVPCVIGTKIATKVFKDGDLVEVDAIEGIVYKLK
ncbi:MAG: hypothetical protein HYV42_02895 [Candidatus Magasanikbacteria bacterium]|nr:hypothetical protein [Candidatus Magasanikbacteria bacterium]